VLILVLIFVLILVLILLLLLICVQVTQAAGVVQTPPLVLPTPGKANVVVTILLDPDG
jgi:hypothetical protein